MKYFIQNWGVIIAGVVVAVTGEHISVLLGACVIAAFLIVEIIILRIFTNDHRLKRQLIERARTYLVFIMLTVAAFSYSMIVFYVMISLLTIDLGMLFKYQFFK